MSHDCAIGMVRAALARGLHVTEVYIDTVGYPEPYEAKMSRLFPAIKFTVRKKADALFPVVSAASICAKVTRDRLLANWVHVEKGVPSGAELPLGSGYPGDERTKRWLRETCDPVFGFPKVVRFS